MPTSNAVRAGRAFVEFFLDDSKLTRGMRGVSRRLERWGATTTRAGRRMLAFGTAAALPLAASIKTFADFQMEMSRVRAVTGASGDTFSALTEKAKELGATTLFTASQAAQGMKFLGMAGLDAGEILASIGPMLDVALIGDLDLGTAADIVTDISTAFGLTAGEITRVADVIAATVTDANTDVQMLGDGMKFAAGVARLAGQSIETTSAAMGILAKAGLKATLAGTSLRRILISLTEDKAIKRLGELGVPVADAEGNIRDLTLIMRDLDAAMVDMSQGERVQLIADLFTIRGVPGVAALTKFNEEFADFASNLRSSSGAASEMSELIQSNLKGDFVELLSATEALQIAYTQGLEPVLRKMTQTVTTHVRSLAEWIGANAGVALAIGAGVTAAIAGGAALLAIGQSLVFASAGLFVASKLMAGLLAVGAVLATPIGAITVAITGATAAWLMFTESGQTALKGLMSGLTAATEFLRSTFRGIFDAIAVGDMALAWDIFKVSAMVAMAETADFILTKWESVKQFFSDVWVGMAIGMNNAIFAMQRTWVEFKTFVINMIETIGASIKNFFTGALQTSIQNIANQLIMARDRTLNSYNPLVRAMGRRMATAGETLADVASGIGGSGDPGLLDRMNARNTARDRELAAIDELQRLSNDALMADMGAGDTKAAQDRRTLIDMLQRERQRLLNEAESARTAEMATGEAGVGAGISGNAELAIGQIGDGLAGIDDEKADPTAALSSFAALRLGGAQSITAMQEMADDIRKEVELLEEQNEHLEELEGLARRGKLVFAGNLA